MVSVRIELKKGKIYPVSILKRLTLTLVENPVKCSFASPAQDYLSKPVDLNELLVTNPTATFLFIADGDCMKDANIVDGSILVIDRSITPEDGSIVLAEINGEHTLKRLDKKLMRLMPENPAFQPIVLKEGMELRICGVVSSAITIVKRSHVRPR